MFYFVFMNLSGRPTRARGWFRPISVAASNAALWMCRIQVALIYLCAGILKLNGDLWQKGMALYDLLQGDSYTHPLAREAESFARRIRQPFTSRHCLEVTCPARTRLTRVMRRIVRLDWWRRVQLTVSPETEHATAFDPESGRSWSGPSALWPILLRVPALLPLAPLAMAGWYVGAAQRLYARWLQQPTPKRAA